MKYQDREAQGKKSFPPDEFQQEEEKEIKESTTDPESGYYVKDERTTLRGLKKLSMQAMLTFTAMNLKKMASWTWKPAPYA